jgi:hypothetical protein
MTKIFVRFIAAITAGLFLTTWLSVCSADQLPPVSGVVALSSGQVTIKTTSVEGKVSNRNGAVGQPIYLNDEVKTGNQARVQLLLKDQSVFNVGQNSALVIDKFIYDPSKSQLSVSIEKGAFKFVSGKISNSNSEAMQVKLPNATIAVRGTRVAGEVNPEGVSTVVLLHGTVDVTSTVQGASSTATLSKSGWGVQVGVAGSISAPTLLPSDAVKGILQKAGVNTAAIPTPTGAGTATTSAGPAATTTASQSNSGLSASELANSIDASKFVSASVAQSFKTSMTNSMNTQTALNGNSNMLSVSVLNDVIANNPAVWSGILQSMGMPANTVLPDAQKQSVLAQYMNSDFANYYALLVFPTTYTPTQIQNASMGPLGTVTFNASNIAMACTTAGGCGANASASINQTVVLNYTAAQMTNTYNVVYSNFFGITGSASGTASSAFSALSANGGSNVNLPGSGAAGTGGTTVNMVGQFGSLGNLVGKWSTLTTSLSSGVSGAPTMRAGYQLKGQ